MIAAAEHIRKTGCRTRLACTGRHDQQKLSEFLLDTVTYRTDRFLLIVAVRDFLIDRYRLQIFPLRPAVHQTLQVIPAEQSAHPPLRRIGIIPEIGFKTIGRKHHRPASKLPLQAVRIEHCLLSADIRIFG